MNKNTNNLSFSHTATEDVRRRYRATGAAQDAQGEGRGLEHVSLQAERAPRYAQDRAGIINPTYLPACLPACLSTYLFSSFPAGCDEVSRAEIMR